MKSFVSTAVFVGMLGGWLAAQTPIFRTPVKVAGSEVNSSYVESSPSITGDGLTLYFSSRRPGGSGGADVWKVHRSDLTAPWKSASPVAGLNTAKDEGGGAVRADDLEFFMTSARQTPVGYLHHATRSSTSLSWSTVVSLGTPISAPCGASGATITADGMELYWHADRSICAGTHLIWRVRRASPGGPFTTLVEKPAFNGTTHVNITPAVSANGLTILWQSNRYQTHANLFGFCIANRATRSAAFSNVRAVPELGTAYGVARSGQWSGDDFSYYLKKAGTGDIYRADRILPICIPTGLPTRGQPFDVACRRDPGDTGIVIGSLWKMPPIKIPGAQGLLNINPSGIIWQAVGKVGNMGRFTTRLRIPDVAGLQGVPIHWQAAAQDPATKIYISPLVTTVIP